MRCSAGERFWFRCAVHVAWPGVAELWSLDANDTVKFLNRFFGRSNENEVPPDELDHWVMAEATNEGDKVIYRLRATRPSLSDIDAYCTGISIRWNYDSDDSGMPPSEVQTQQCAFEEGIDELTMYNGHSFLMLVSTGIGSKEWLFYAKDRGEFMDSLNAALRSHPKYPLKIEFYDDAEWKIWNDIVNAIHRHRN